MSEGMGCPGGMRIFLIGRRAHVPQFAVPLSGISPTIGSWFGCS